MFLSQCSASYKISEQLPTPFAPWDYWEHGLKVVDSLMRKFILESNTAGELLQQLVEVLYGERKKTFRETLV